MLRYKVIGSTKNLLIEREAAFSELDDAKMFFQVIEGMHEHARIIDMEENEVIKTVG